MRKILFMIAAIFAVAIPLAPASAIQCVPYARQVSGIHLQGDAWQWWNAAAGVYARGATPRPGAVLVFSRQGHMYHGHVSVITRVISNRMVLVDHANWAPVRGAGRGKIARGVPVLDVSPHNDWSEVRVWYRPVNQYGNRIYRTDGFVYGNHRGRSPIRMASLETGDLPHLPLPRPHYNEAGDHAAGRVSSAGLVTVGNYAFHPRPRPTMPTNALASSDNAGSHPRARGI